MSTYSVGERRYVRFADEWDEPQSDDGNPRWFTAVYTGQEDVGGPIGREGRWDVDGMEDWSYGESELVIGAPATGKLWPPLPAPRDRSVTKP